MASPENLDPKTDAKIKAAINSAEKIKENRKFAREYISCAQKMLTAASNFSVAMKGWVNSINILSMQNSDELGSSLSRITLLQSAISESFELFSKNMQVEGLNFLDQSSEGGLKEAENFLAELKTQSKKRQSDLNKFEQKMKKSSKGGDNSAFRDVMKEYNATREEIDEFKSQMLKKILLIERQRFGDILLCTKKFMTQQSNMGRVLMNLQEEIQIAEGLEKKFGVLPEEQVQSFQTKTEHNYLKLNTNEESSGAIVTDATNTKINTSMPFNASGSQLGSNPPAPAGIPAPPAPAGMPAPPAPMGIPAPPAPVGMPAPPNHSRTLAPPAPSGMPPPPFASGLHPPPAPAGMPAPPPMGGNGRGGGGGVFPSGGPRAPSGVSNQTPSGVPAPPPSFNPPKLSSGSKSSKSSASKPSDNSADRSDLLGSITGFKGGLKKVKTVDKSAPLLKTEKGPGMMAMRGRPGMF